MEIISHIKIIETIKNHFPNFMADIGQVEIKYSDRSVYVINRIENSNKSTDLIADLLQFEEIASEIDLYQYRKPSYLQDIRDGKTRIDSLNKYLKSGDKSELTTGIKSLFQSIDVSSSAFGSFKKDHYIFCLTDQADSDYHFSQFNEACVKFRFIPKHRSSLIKFYKVKYLAELENFSRLKREIQKTFNLELKVKNGMTLAPFIKNDFFKLEHEYRILFTIHMEKLLNRFKIDDYEMAFLNSLNKCDSYIEIPLDNPLFQLKVVEIRISNKNG